MSSLKRHHKIIEIVNLKGYETVANLCKELKVSAVTIRKDLKLLEKNNKLFRTHGGASNTNPFTIDRHVKEKENLQFAYDGLTDHSRNKTVQKEWLEKIQELLVQTDAYANYP